MSLEPGLKRFLAEPAELIASGDATSRIIEAGGLLAVSVGFVRDDEGAWGGSDPLLDFSGGRNYNPNYYDGNFAQFESSPPQAPAKRISAILPQTPAALVHPHIASISFGPFTQATILNPLELRHKSSEERVLTVSKVQQIARHVLGWYGITSEQ